MIFSEQVLSFIKNLSLPGLPENIDVLNPYLDRSTLVLCTKFYTQYYNDSNKRTIILGINPGRFGGGLTGIPFTDPMKLESICQIPNTLQKKPELSADFIYAMISEYGGAEKFYSKFFVSAVCPLGFIKDNKNINYYDSKALQAHVMDFIVRSLHEQLTFGINTDIAYCLGEGDNYKFLKKLNRDHNFFRTLIPLPHPRFIMQYRRKQIKAFITIYLEAFDAK
jgi:hypothetical protein